MSNCLNCNQETTNPKFCSRSCAAIYNNKLHPKRVVEGKCKSCLKPITTELVFCSDECRKKSFKTKEEVKISKNLAVKSYIQRLKIRAIEYKGGCCEICGYDRCLAALEFHHLDPTQKDFSISGRSIKFSRIEKELDKCILVCSNCHRELHSTLVAPGGTAPPFEV